MNLNQRRKLLPLLSSFGCFMHKQHEEKIKFFSLKDDILLKKFFLSVLRCSATGDVYTIRQSLLEMISILQL